MNGGKGRWQSPGRIECARDIPQKHTKRSCPCPSHPPSSPTTTVRPLAESLSQVPSTVTIILSEQKGRAHHNRQKLFFCKGHRHMEWWYTGRFTCQAKSHTGGTKQCLHRNQNARMVGRRHRQKTHVCMPHSPLCLQPEPSGSHTWHTCQFICLSVCPTVLCQHGRHTSLPCQPCLFTKTCCHVLSHGKRVHCLLQQCSESCHAA